MEKKKNRRRFSINFLLIFVIAVALLAFTVLTIVQTALSAHIIRNRVTEAESNVVANYLGEIESELNSAALEMVSLSITDSSYMTLGSSEDSHEITLAKNDLASQLNWMQMSLSYVDSLFVCSTEDNFLLYGENAKVSRTLQIRIAEQIWRASENLQKNLGMKWQVLEVEGEYYLLFLRERYGLFFGAWTRVDSLLPEEGLFELGTGGGALFLDTQGNVLTDSAILTDKCLNLAAAADGYDTDGRLFGGGSVAIGKYSELLDISLVFVLADSHLYQNIQQVRWFAVITVCMISGLMAVAFFVLRRAIIQPLNSMIDAMRRIGQGNLDTRVSTEGEAPEFDEVFGSLNRMTEEISRLKIGVYEERLERQRAEIQYLRLQVKPHFYVNCINILASMAHEKNYEQIVEMCGLLADFFRQKLGFAKKYTTLEDEFRLIQVFLRIQELRYPDKFSSALELPDTLKEVRIPIMMVETFVENSFKYAVPREGKRLIVDVRAELTFFNGMPGVRVQILDNGEGFPQEFLDSIGSAKYKNGNRVGIQNVMDRLEQDYRGAASVHLFIRDCGGAGVELLVPLEIAAEEDEHV